MVLSYCTIGYTTAAVHKMNIHFIQTSFDLQNIRVFGISLEYFTEDNIKANKWKTDEMEVDESKEKYKFGRFRDPDTRT